MLDETNHDDWGVMLVCRDMMCSSMGSIDGTRAWMTMCYSRVYGRHNWHLRFPNGLVGGSYFLRCYP